MTPLNQKMYPATRISFTMSSHLWFIPLLSIQAFNINSFSDGCSLLFWLILRFKVISWEVHLPSIWRSINIAYMKTFQVTFAERCIDCMKDLTK